MSPFGWGGRSVLSGLELNGLDQSKGAVRLFSALLLL